MNFKKTKPTSLNHHVCVSRLRSCACHLDALFHHALPLCGGETRMARRLQSSLGTGEDYSELPPRLERLLLPFPKSPLRHKNPEHPENVMPPPGPPLRERSVSPEPTIGLHTIHTLTAWQVLVETQYIFDKDSAQYSKLVRFWIRPFNHIPANLHASPQFVRRHWTPDQARPPWMTPEAFIHGPRTAYSITALESVVRACPRYAARNAGANSAVEADLLDWAFALTPPEVRSRAASSNQVWPAMTPPGKARKSKSTRRHAERIHYDLIF
ncbi:hypothetical protein C8J57DRAFT_1464935 [Mycena rebaudengoi]|nr:hypothetical protein C8J57DRAFT_1464935 [Mycena rebaudengoi]